LSAGDHIDVFSASTNSFSSPISVPSLTGTKQIAGLALTPDGSKLLVADIADQSVAILNPDTPTVGTALVHIAGPLLDGMYTPGPFEIAATSTNNAFVGLGVNTRNVTGGSLGLVELDLGTLQVTQRSDVGTTISGNYMQGSADGTKVIMGTPNDSGGEVGVWSAANDTWIAHSTGEQTDQFINDVAASSDGRILVVNNNSGEPGGFPFPFIMDGQANIIAQANFPDFQAIGDLAGEQLDQTGALLYAPTSVGVDIIDTRTGQLRERIYLNETLPFIYLAAVNKILAITPDGSEIFVATTTGLTVIQLDSVPLGIGSVSPSSGPAGAMVTLRGTGFVSGTTATVGGSAAAVSFSDSSTLTISIPSSLPNGSTQITLANPDGSILAVDAAFTVN
jgi:hypothetical protein